MLRVTTCATCGVTAACYGDPPRCVRTACQDADGEPWRAKVAAMRRGAGGRWLPGPVARPADAEVA